MMRIPARIVAAVLLAFGAAPAARAQDAARPMQMDHGGMNHGATPTKAGAEKTPGEARDPHAYSDGFGFDEIPRPRLADEKSFGSVLVERLERSYSRDGDATAYDVQAWFGRDYDRAVLKAEGEVAGGSLEDARTELLWGHAVASFWDTQLGVRYDSGTGPDRGWLAFGVQGLAPYWFNVEATAYAGDEGRSALRLAGSYELLLTQKLILEPRLEANAYGKSDPARELGSGLADAAVGLRLRYEFRREFAPYVGIERAAKFGATADYARAAGAPSAETRVVAGMRIWF